MAFCKICACGKKIVFQRRTSPPDECQYCGRRLMNFTTFDENDPQVSLLLNNDNDKTIETKQEHEVNDENEATRFILLSNENEEIEIPEEGGIIGRTELGAEVLAKYPSVSKKHIRILPSFGNRIVIEDISRFGTYINGIKMEKNVPQRVAIDAKIRLCNVDFTLYEKI